MADQKTTVLNIEVNYQDGIKKIAEYRTEIDKLRESEKGYKEQRDAGEITQQRYNELMTESKLKTKEYNDSIRVISKQLSNQMKIQKEQEGSLTSLRAQLSNLTSEYDKMSEAERKSAEGLVLKDKINEVTDAIKGGEEETQRYYRNVGNYQESLAPLFEQLEEKLENQKKKYEELKKTQGEHAKATKKQKKEMEDTQLEFDFFTKSAEDADEAILGFISTGVGLDASLIKMLKGIHSLGQGARMAGVALKSLGKQLLVLMANPIVAFLAVLSAGIMAIVNGIKSSEENMNRWKIAMAPVTRLLDALCKVMQNLAGFILNVVEAGGKMLAWIDKQLEKLPLIGDKMKEVNKQNEEYIRMAKERYAIDKDARQLEVDNAKNELEIAKLRTIAEDKLHYSAKERLAAVQKANRMEEEASKRNYELAKRKYDLMVAENAMAENTKETNDAIAQAEVAMYSARKEYYEKSRELITKENELREQIKAEREAELDAAKADMKAKNEAEKKALEERQKAEAEAAQRAIDMKAKELAEVRKAEDELMNLIKDDLDKQRVMTETQYNREIEDLQARLATETDLTTEAKAAINEQIYALEEQKYNDLDALSEEALQRDLERLQRQFDQEAELRALDYEARLLEREEQGANDEQLEMERRFIELEELVSFVNEQKTILNSMRREEGESQAEFDRRRLAQQKKINNTELQIQKTKVDSEKALYASTRSAIDALAEHSKAFAILSKTLALGEIAVNTGKAMAAGIAQAQSVPFPANLVAIATTVATILGNVASAVSIVKSAKFAEGGLVTGPGTGTSDSINAKLSNGESVMTASTTSMFAPILSPLNQMGGGVPIDVAETSRQQVGQDMLAEAFAKGLENLHPVVSVEEITEVSNRVKVIENVGNL